MVGQNRPRSENAPHYFSISRVSSFLGKGTRNRYYESASQGQRYRAIRGNGQYRKRFVSESTPRCEEPVRACLPRVSVVIPTYNRSALVVRAIRSVLANECAGDEIIVVDDGSTDDTQAALAVFGDRIRYIRTANLGAGAARNRGIDESRNELIAFLDSDDEWMADKLGLQRALMAKRPEVVFCFSDFAVKRADGALERCYLSNWHRDERGWNEILGPGASYSEVVAPAIAREDFQVHMGSLYAALMATNYVPTFTLMIRREACAAARFATDLPTNEDWEYFGQIARLGRAAYLDTETAVQWGHKGPRLTDADDFRSAWARIRVLERVWGRDAEYLASHSVEYHQVLAHQHEVCARWLLEKGRMREARHELELAPGSRTMLRILSLLPGPLVHALFGVVNFCRMVLLEDYST